MNGSISVIVPVYNVEAYLPQCVDSILSQDYRDLEVILIDDGSTDGSGRICDQYADIDGRVRVIHQKNAGAAAAKNAGLRVASGEFLSFVDSDDYLEPDVYGLMVRTLLENQADAVQFSFREVYRTRAVEKHLQEETLTGEEYLLRFPKDYTCALLWNKLYRMELFAGVFFEEGHKIDDEYFTYQGFLQPRRVVCRDTVGYNYRRRLSSVMCSPESAEQLVLDRLDSTAKRRQKVLSCLPHLRRAFDENYLDVLWYLSENSGSTERTISQIKSRLRAYFCQWGNTFPPVYLWKLLLRLYVTPTDKLLAKCQQGTGAEDRAEFFP